MEEAQRSEAPGRETLAGTVRVFSAEALLFPTGLVTAAYLTRVLGADGYGVFSLAAMAVALVEWTLISLFSRSTILVVRGSANWRPVATRILQVHLATALVAAAALWLSAPALARGLEVPALADHLRLFAVDVPLFVLAHGHRNVSTAMGGFGHRARIVAARWVSRMILVILLVALGLSIRGAILGSIGASLVELAVSMRYDRAPLLARVAVPIRPFFWTTAPLFAAAIAQRVVHDMDLFALKALGASTAEAGYYAAARNLAIAGSAFSAAFTPLLLSTLVRLVGEGAADHARDMARDAIRLMLLLAPFAALTAGASAGIVRLVFGREFGPAAPLMAWLVFASLAGATITLGCAILAAGGELRGPVRILGALVPATFVAHLWAIPRWGALGAAIVTTGATTTGMLFVLVAAARTWRMSWPVWTLLRTAGVALAVGLAARAWIGAGPHLVAKLALSAGAVPLLLLALGEFSRRELQVALRAALPWWGRDS